MFQISPTHRSFRLFCLVAAALGLFRKSSVAFVLELTAFRPTEDRDAGSELTPSGGCGMTSLLGMKRGTQTPHSRGLMTSIPEVTKFLIANASGQSGVGVQTQQTSKGYAVICASLLCLLVAFRGAFAQGTTGSIGGIVDDKSGAVIVGARVVLKDLASSSERETKSNGSGLFNFVGVPSGDYQLTILAQGFESFKQEGIHLDPGDERSVRNIALTPGKAAETITVTEAPAQVQTDGGEVSSTITSNDIDHLAVVGRDVTELLKILPGMAISQGTTPENRGYDPSVVNFTGALNNFTSNGMYNKAVALLNDGADLTDPGSGYGGMQNVNYDQVAEVKITTGSFTADTAHGPLVINAIGKSGGDRYHGSLYVDGRTNQLNSVDALAKTFNQVKPADRQIYPGFTVGGPVRIPFTHWNNQNKLTFFVGGEEYAQRNVYAYNSVSYSILNALVPTAAMRTGDFSLAQIQAYLGNEYTTTTTNGVTSCSGTYASLCPVPSVSPTGSPIVNGNLSPYMDPLSKSMLNVLPLPNKPSAGGYNYSASNLVDNNMFQARGRLDYVLNENTRLFAVYNTEQGLAYQPQTAYGLVTGNLGGVNYPGGGQSGYVQSHAASLNLNSVLGSSFTNEFYAAGVYFHQPFIMRNPALTQTNPYQFVYPYLDPVMPAMTDTSTDGLPYDPIQSDTFGAPFAAKQIRIAGDNATKLLGRHTFRAGIFYQWVVNLQSGQIQYTNGQVSVATSQASFTDPILGKVYNVGSGTNTASGDNYLANFAEGHLSTFTQYNKSVEPVTFFWNLSEYLQDHWRITNHLTLDLGVRLEHITPWSDARGIGFAVFDPSAYTAGTPAGDPGLLYHAINPSTPLAGVPTRAVFPEPRVGFAWDPYGKGTTILRGGAGVYHSHDSFNDIQLPAATGLGQTKYSTTGSGGVQFSTLNYYQAAASTVTGFKPDTTIYVLDPNDDKMPTTTTYNLMIDQFLPHGMMFEVGYVGNRIQDLLNTGSNLYNINALPFGALFNAQPSSRPDTASTAGLVFPFFTPSASGSHSLQNITTAMIDSFRPYPLYASVDRQTHDLISNYNSLQARYLVRLDRFTGMFNYTWSKALTNVAGPDPTNDNNDYMPATFDRRHIINGTYSYSVGSITSNRWLSLAANGWRISGTTSLQTGVYLPAVDGYNYSLAATLAVPKGSTATINGNTSSCNSTTCSFSMSPTLLFGSPDILMMPHYTGNPHGIAPHQYINPSVMQMPTLQTNGQYRVPDVRGPLYFNSDLSAKKIFHIKDTREFTVGLAASNFLNHANTSFTSQNSGNYHINFNTTFSSPVDVGSVLPTLTNQQPLFGSPVLSNGTLIKAGRRLVLISLKYSY